MQIKRLVPPLAPCHVCSAEYSGTVCPVCKEENPTFTAIKNISRPAQPSCRYYTSDSCNCAGRGLCLEPA